MPVVKVEERVVVERVPMVKAQVVYRDRDVLPAMSLWGQPIEPVKLEPIVVRLATAPMTEAPTVRQQVRPAELAGEGEGAEPSATESDGEAPEDNTTDAGVRKVDSAIRSPSA